MDLGKTVVEKGSCSLALQEALRDALFVDVSPVELFKARKNQKEIQGAVNPNPRHCSARLTPTPLQA
jgi:hypothetical protein